MRFDDTNPEAEKPEYIRSILGSVEWLEHKYEKITHTSDYFEELYQLAVNLILMGKAYVCNQTQEEVKKSRETLIHWHQNNTGVLESLEENEELLSKIPKEAISPHRNRSVEENLDMFRNMRQGLYKEGEVTLRMKQNLTSPNANLWDQMAYRILYKAHPKTGDAWCIYPTYDYSHCLIDSLENITHSLCTLEFESRQSNYGSYHWLVHCLGLYHAQTWEFSRCSISRNIMSKRRLNKLVVSEIVNGWDDPRLLTLDGLKRRGYTPKAINEFCESTGIARSSNTVCIKNSVLEHFIRKDLNESAERRFAIINPVKVVIKNYQTTSVMVPNFPQAPEKGERTVLISNEVFIPRHKFRDEEEVSTLGIKNYKGLVVGGSAKLLYGPKIKCVSFDKESNIINCEVDVSESSKAPAAIPWVNSKAFVEVEARCYEPLFIDCVVDGVEVHAEKAAKAQGKEYIELLNPDSCKVEKIVAELAIKKDVLTWLEESNPKKETRRWQFVTLGYFAIDPDTSSEKIVLNRVVSLKENKTLRK